MATRNMPTVNAMPKSPDMKAKRYIRIESTLVS